MFKRHSPNFFKLLSCVFQGCSWSVCWQLSKALFFCMRALPLHQYFLTCFAREGWLSKLIQVQVCSALLNSLRACSHRVVKSTYLFLLLLVVVVLFWVFLFLFSFLLFVQYSIIDCYCWRNQLWILSWWHCSEIRTLSHCVPTTASVICRTNHS